MPWENNSGGPWGGGGNRGGGGGRGNGGGGGNSPWGRPGGGGGGGRGPGGQPPDMEELVRKGQERLKSMMPGGLGGKGIAAIVVVAIVGWMVTGFYRVEPQQLGVELIFGEQTAETQQGLQWNWPTPIGEVILPNVTSINQVNIGFQELSGGTKRNIDEESLMLTGDENIVQVQFSVFWQISNAGDFLFNVRNPEESVRNAAEAAMREIVGKSGFEYIRTRGRNAVGQDAQVKIQEILDSYEAGIRIVQVNPQSVEPPGEVISAFRDVQAANADRERAINQATGYFNQVTQQAEGEAQRILRAAEAYKEERINQAKGDSQRFLSILTEFETAPDITKRRIYLQTMEEILERMDKVLIQNGGEGQDNNVVPYLPLDRLTNTQRGTNQ